MNDVYQKTLVLIKHDGVSRGLVGEILSRFERIGLKIVALKMVLPSKELADKHYLASEEWCINIGNRILEDYSKSDTKNIIEDFGTNNAKDIGMKIKEWNNEFLIAGPVIAIVLEGPEAIDLVRKMVGSTSPLESPMGTIRGDYTWDNRDISSKQKRPMYNLIHASSSIEDSKYEVNLWFSDSEICNYKTSDQDFMGWSSKLK